MIPNVLLVFIISVASFHHQVLAQPANQNHPTLRGLTSLRPPFVEKDLNGKLRGYYVDLLDELAAVGNFNYTLTDSANQDNDVYQNRPTGLMNEVYRNRADFAIADNLYRTPNIERNRYVDFSEPYLESNLSALIRKDRAAQFNIRTIEDLLERLQPKTISSMIPIPMNDLNKQQQQQQQQPPAEEQLQMGTIRQIYGALSMGTDKLSRRIYEQIQNNPANIAENREMGVQRALNQPYAFIQESIYNELVVDEHCELTHIKVEFPEFPIGTHFEYGIVGQKYSSHMETFNRSIRELKSNGRLDELKRRYWNRKCNSGSNPFQNYRYLLTVATTVISLFMSLFILS